jgi:ubiquinone/menaquinone biosynthesis C-methylase UbiE
MSRNPRNKRRLDVSDQMLELARNHLNDTDLPRVRFYLADARNFAGRRYDLIVTHFFLDCFNDYALRHLANSVAQVSTAEALWVNSEFAVPASGWLRARARLWVATLYRAFGWLTGLEISRLPDYKKTMNAAGFELQNERTSNAGLLNSELWKKVDSAT